VSASKHKLAAEVFGLLRQASPGSNGLTLCVFVDLNAPPEATQVIATRWTGDFRPILPQNDRPVVRLDGQLTLALEYIQAYYRDGDWPHSVRPVGRR